jgi:putative transposase
MLDIARSTLDYQPAAESAEDRKIKRLMDEIYLRDACLGTRRLVTVLERDHGLVVNRKRLQRLRREMGLETIYCRPRTSVPEREHVKYPYLLRELAITRPNQVWCADITYVPMPHGHAFLCAVMDWHSRKVLGWALSNTMDVALVVAALTQAAGDGSALPEIMNTDQGSQFTAVEWIEELKGRSIAISMDGKGRWMDNVFIERLWRSVKYEDIYLHEYATIAALEAGLRRWFEQYNCWRPHAALGGQTPAQAHGNKSAAGSTTPLKAAA